MRGISYPEAKPILLPALELERPLLFLTMYLYLDKDTSLHRLNPITKILGLVLLFGLPLYFTTLQHLIPSLLFVLFLACLGRCLRNIRRMGPFVLMLGGFSTVLWALFHREGTPLVGVGLLSISLESLLYGLGMGVRLAVLLLSGLVFLSVTRIEEFAMGLRKMGLPFSVGFALSLAFRLVPLFFSTGTTIVQAQRARGLDLETGNLLHRIRKYIPLLIPIFIYAVRGADLLAMALESKGFGAQKERTYYLRFRMRPIDYAALSLLVLMNLFSLMVSLSM